jgi:hypothetical protein
LVRKGRAENKVFDKVLNSSTLVDVGKVVDAMVMCIEDESLAGKSHVCKTQTSRQFADAIVFFPPTTAGEALRITPEYGIDLMWKKKSKL